MAKQHVQKFFNPDGSEPQGDNPMMALLTGLFSDDEQSACRKAQAPGRTVYSDDDAVIAKVQKDHAAEVRKAEREGLPIPPEPTILPPVTLTVSGIVNKSPDREGKIAARINWELAFYALLSRVNQQTADAVVRQMVAATLEAVRDPNNIGAAEAALWESLKPIIVEARDRIMVATVGTISGQTRMSQVAVTIHEPEEALVG